jgi:hypothetical protein
MNERLKQAGAWPVETEFKLDLEKCLHMDHNIFHMDGKGVVVDVTVGEIESFIAEVPPRGIYLCISTGSPEEEEAVLKRVEKW